MKNHVDHFLNSLINWLFKVWKPEASLVKGGLFIILAALSTPLWLILLDKLWGYVSPGNGLNDFYATLLPIGIGFALVIWGTLIALREREIERENNSKKRVVIIEARGLRDDSGHSLTTKVKEKFKFQSIELPLDFRNRTDGEIMIPSQAIDRALANHASLMQQKDAINREDLTLVYGGLAPVPYTFLTGVLVDDEGDFEVYDWDRTATEWREIDSSTVDDNQSFVKSGVDNIDHSTEVVLAVSFSYKVQDENLSNTFSCPIIRMDLDPNSTDTHWSKQKQMRLTKELLDVLIKLEGKSVQKIHLVLAAPNSFVFNFGRAYDKRNLPEIIVYQFERDQVPAYPWGIRMPVAGNNSAGLIQI